MVSALMALKSSPRPRSTPWPRFTNRVASAWYVNVLETSFVFASTSSKKLGLQRRVRDDGHRMVCGCRKLPVVEVGQERLTALESWCLDGQDGNSDLLYSQTAALGRGWWKIARGRAFAIDWNSRSWGVPSCMQYAQ